MFLLYFKPFEMRLLNYMEIFNEFCLLDISYHLLLFTDFISSSDEQYTIGFSIIGIALLNILVNMIVMTILTFICLKVVIKNLINKIKIYLK